jgi:hypothetical protein
VKILLSGDLHGDHDIGRISKKNLRKRGIVPEEISYLIVLGDWGVVWGDDQRSLAQEAYLKRWYDSMPWETLVLLGNHEGYDRIETLVWTERHGGPVRQASERSYILKNGGIYTVGGLEFFIFGGAASQDRDQRTPHKSWWPQEIPTEEDLRRGIQSLDDIYGEVDYVLTHTCPSAMAEHLAHESPAFLSKYSDPVCAMLATLEKHVRGAKRWYFGHYHLDVRWKNYQCLWNELVVLETS